MRIVKRYGARFSDGEKDEVVMSSDKSRKVAAAPRVYGYRHDGQRTVKVTLYPFVDPETKEFDFLREARVSLWGYTPKSNRPDDDPEDDVCPSPREELRDEDLDRLSAYVDNVRDSMQFEVKQHDQAYVNLRRHTIAA